MKEQGGIFLTILRAIAKIIPGDYLRTFIYLNLISAPRKFLRKYSGGFYRMDHIYEVLKEFKTQYKGNYSILEFGVADGYSFTKKLYATRYLNMDNRLTVHGFDTFEGLPEVTTSADDALVEGSDWQAGFYRGRYENLQEYCSENYQNFELHRGLFDKTLTDDFLQSLIESPPILIWIDCDYYSSTKVVFERLIPHIPTGCVIYFDDIYFNFSSRFTGEMRAVWELNHGQFGEGLELVRDEALSLDSNRIYRFININQKSGYELVNPEKTDPVRRRQNDSPLP